MGEWLSLHCFDLVQTVGIVGGLLYTARIARKDQEARTITNLLTVNEQYSRIWRECYERPELGRVLQKDVDLEKQPMTNAEALFVKSLVLHLDVVRRTTDAGIFVEIEGLEKDIRGFFELPIPNAAWEAIRPFQDNDFVKFVEDSAKG